VTTVRIDVPDVSWEQWIMLRSDAHHDSVWCRRDIELAQLGRAGERRTWIIDAGDLFDGMQGRYDPRRSYEDVRPEDVGVDYYDRIVDHAAADYMPYRDNWLLFGQGNHETAVLRHTNHSLTTALHRALGAGHIGGYGGWVRFAFTVHGTKRSSLRLKYHHGAGGGGPVTRGVIQTNRQAVYLPDADIVLNGHTHDAWVLSIARERLNDAGRVTRDLVRFVRTPGYKDEYGSEFSVEHWMPPKPLGCVWLRMFVEDSMRGRIGVDVIEDITGG